MTLDKTSICKHLGNIYIFILQIECIKINQVAEVSVDKHMW